MDTSRCEVSRVFIGAGCNRIVHNVSWGASGLVAFGANNAVAIFDPKTSQILTTLSGHKGTVNCTHWIPTSKFAFQAKELNQHYLLSGDTEGVLILWEYSLVDRKWRYVQNVPEPHKKGVTCITAIMISQTEAIFASTSSDCTLGVWKLMLPSTSGNECKLSSIDSLSVGNKPMVALSLAELPDNAGHLILAMGGLDNKIHLYYGERTGKFVHACDLKGHSDWIRSLDFSLPVSIDGEANTLLLVSSSQDKGIRIWKIISRDSSKISEGTRLASLASYIEGPVLVARSSSYQISLESLLIGHEDWVYSVEWHPPLFSMSEGTDFSQPLTLLSASMDKTMMIWQPQKAGGIWMNVVTVGELSHCALGFYGGHWSPDGKSILAHGYGGSFHLWRNIGVEYDNWQPQNVPSGHHAVVSDIGWARSGEYLLSVSHDQTSRIFAPWKTEDTSVDGDSWHEIARPQVHGHDINCVAVIKGKGNQRFVSGAEEKVARVFEAPLSFLKTLNCASSVDGEIQEDIQGGAQILGANMSALGLSQKPIFVQASRDTDLDRNGGEGIDTFETVPDALPVTLTEPPIEEQIAWHTLWPESHKLYGHGNELFTLCSDHQGKLMASSCKAKTSPVAEIWLWQVGSWKAVGRLQSHDLTVIQMEFSHDDTLLLAVSRDLHLSVFSIQRKGEDEFSSKLVAKQKAHKRVIWTCCWNPYKHEFATGSRDKTVKIWAVEESTSSSSVRCVLTLPQFSSSVTALSWLGLDRHTQNGLLAVGMESGLIEMWALTRPSEGNEGLAASLVLKLDPFLCHASTVQRLAWRDREKAEACDDMQLASCGADHCVRVFKVKLSLESR